MFVSTLKSCEVFLKTLHSCILLAGFPLVHSNFLECRQLGKTGDETLQYVIMNAPLLATFSALGTCALASYAFLRLYFGVVLHLLP